MCVCVCVCVCVCMCPHSQLSSAASNAQVSRWQEELGKDVGWLPQGYWSSPGGGRGVVYLRVTGHHFCVTFYYCNLRSTEQNLPACWGRQNARAILLRCPHHEC